MTDYLTPAVCQPFTGHMHRALKAMDAWSRAQAMPAGGVIIGPGALVHASMFGPEHPARKATLAMLRAWNRRRIFQGYARSTLNLSSKLRAECAAAVAADAARIRAAIREIREAPMPRDVLPPEGDSLTAYHCTEAVRLMKEARRHLRFAARAHACLRTRVNAARVAGQLERDERDMRVIFGVPDA